MMLKQLRKIAAQTQALQEEADRNPLLYFRPTPPQEAFLRDPAKIKLLRGGNQVH